MGIEREAVVLMLPRDIAMVRVQIGAKSALWSVAVSEMIWVPGAGPFAFQLSGNITGAEFNEALDERISNQRDSISRLLDHLKVHCPSLLGTGGCPHIEKV